MQQIKRSGDTLAMKVVTVKPLSPEGMDAHMDGTRTLPLKKKGKREIRENHRGAQETHAISYGGWETSETLYHRDGAFSTQPVLHYQGTAYLGY